MHQTMEEYNRTRILTSGESYNNPFYQHEITSMLEFQDLILTTSVVGLVRRFDILVEEAEYLYSSAQRFDDGRYVDDEIKGEELFDYLYVLSRVSAIAKGEVH